MQTSYKDTWKRGGASKPFGQDCSKLIYCMSCRKCPRMVNIRESGSRFGVHLQPHLRDQGLDVIKKRKTRPESAHIAVWTIFSLGAPDNYGSESQIGCLLKRFMFDGFLPQTSHDFLHNDRFLGFLLLIPSSLEIKLLQTIGSHVADQLHSPLSFICSPWLFEEALFNFLYIFNVLTSPKKVDRWVENLTDPDESQMTTLNATIDPFANLEKRFRQTRNKDAAHAHRVSQSL